jgi:hypothetical protein
VRGEFRQRHISMCNVPPVLMMLSARLEVILRLYCDKEHRIWSVVKVHMRAVMGLRRWKSRGGIFDSSMTRRGSFNEILFTRRAGDEALIIGSIIEPIYSGNTVAVWSRDLYSVPVVMSAH